MQEHDLVAQIAELAARLKRMERWQDQWRTRNRKVAELLADGIQSESGYLVTATQGLAANFHKELDPPSQGYPAGWTLLEEFLPAEGYHSIVPAWWELPPKIGEVTTQISVGFTDDTFVTRSNWTGTATRTVRADVDFDKDGLAVKVVRFEAWNNGESAETQDLGLFKFEGEQF